MTESPGAAQKQTSLISLVWLLLGAMRIAHYANHRTTEDLFMGIGFLLLSLSIYRRQLFVKPDPSRTSSALDSAAKIAGYLGLASLSYGTILLFTQ